MSYRSELGCSLTKWRVAGRTPCKISPGTILRDYAILRGERRLACPMLVDLKADLRSPGIKSTKKNGRDKRRLALYLSHSLYPFVQ